MIETRIVEKNEKTGNENTILFPESHDLNGPGNEHLLTNAARYLIDSNYEKEFQTILKSNNGLIMFDGMSVQNLQPLLESLTFSIGKQVSNIDNSHHIKSIIGNLATLGSLALMFYPKKKMYWKIIVK